MTYNETDIVTYLREHPDFFKEQGELLSSLNFPHITDGQYQKKGVISIFHRQIELLREENKQLEEQIAKLIKGGDEYVDLLRRFSQLLSSLAQVVDLKAVRTILSKQLADIFGALQTELFFKDIDTELEVAEPGLLALLDKKSCKTAIFCGRLSHKDKKTLLKGWKDREDQAIESLMIARLNCGAYWVISSDDQYRFHADMYTGFIELVIGVIDSLLQQLLTQKRLRLKNEQINSTS